MPDLIRVVIADDSALMRHILRKVFRDHRDIQVIGEARNGREAVRKVMDLSPDVLLLDVEMPELNGISALGEIMQKCPLPVIMFSAWTKKGASVTLEALSLGAVDFMPKPELRVNVESVAGELCKKIRDASKARPRGRHRAHDPVKEKASPKGRSSTLIVIGSSAGGPQALETVLPSLPRDFPGSVVVCQHMPPGFTASFARRLDSVCAVNVREACEGDRLLKGRILVAPGGYHLRIKRGQDAEGPFLALGTGEPVHGVKPAVDLTLQDAGPLFGENLLAVILTGMGYDGVQGAKDARAWGATVFCQDRDTSVVWGMPGACVAAGAYDRVAPLDAMGSLMTRFVRERCVP